jgi:hypothetical protein
MFQAFIREPAVASLLALTAYFKTFAGAEAGSDRGKGSAR